VLWSLVLASLLAGCGQSFRRFPTTTPPVWDDVADRRAYGPRPEEYYSPFVWDGADQMIFRPLARLLAVEATAEAVDVNAMDEVPDSSWYENRLSRHDLTSEEFVQAACEGTPPDATGPWTIVAAKPNGANPGFMMEAQNGNRYLLKFDSGHQPERATSADVVGSILYWAAGYHAPCNRIVYFDPAILHVGEGVTVEQGTHEVPLTLDMLADIWPAAPHLPDGRVRAAASQLLPGRPVGPWRYEGTRDHDPNDVIPHQERRELRGAYVLASWINHWDSREQNTLGVWMSSDETNGHIRHYYLDFGESFGSLWAIEGISRRFGHSSYFDFPHVAEDFLTLGLIPRPWNDAHYGPAGETLGYYDVRRFVADLWQPAYPNPSFLRATERDKAWMARIVAKMRPEDIQAAVDAAQIHAPVVRRELYRILMGRRELILKRWLRDLSPLTSPSIEPTVEGDGARMCLQDLAVHAGIVEPIHRPYWARGWIHTGGASVTPIEVGSLSRRDPDKVCVGLPRAPNVSPDHAAYLVVDVAALHDIDDERSAPLRVHMVQLSATDYRVVGIERPYDRDRPGR